MYNFLLFRILEQPNILSIYDLFYPKENTMFCDFRND